MKKSYLVIAVFCLTALFAFTTKAKKEKFKDLYSFVPSGTFSYYPNDTNKISVQAFYMSSGEITNKQYREFLNDLKTNGKSDDYAEAVPDSTLWSNKSNFMEPFVNLYFNHPAYDNYPVVNITKKGAEMYCVWLTENMRKKYPKLNFNDFRLPTKHEWVYAAKGGLKLSPYPWGGPYLRNSKGCLLANFAHVGEQNITQSDSGKFVIVDKTKFQYDFSDIGNDAYVTAPTKSYTPNGYGLYNMAGNVAEMVAKEDLVMGGSWQSPGHDIQTTSEAKYNGASPTVGFRVVSSYVVGQ
jgi:formylglycine-generating enzyme required for sulfatase activity